jgi:hypothetical protein
MQRLKTFGFLLAISGIVIIFMSTILPTIKLPQTFLKKGPSIKLDENTTYWIDTWILPPITEGTPFSVNLEGSHPGGLGIAILPSRYGEVIAGSSPLLSYVFTPIQQRLSINTIAPMSSEYTVFIGSVMNNFTLTINSNWSPFYVLRVYLYVGLGALPVGLLIIYYSKIKESRENVIREALKADSR